MTITTITSALTSTAARHMTDQHPSRTCDRASSRTRSAWASSSDVTLHPTFLSTSHTLPHQVRQSNCSPLHPHCFVLSTKKKNRKTWCEWNKHSIGSTAGFHSWYNSYLHETGMIGSPAHRNLIVLCFNPFSAWDVLLIWNHALVEQYESQFVSSMRYNELPYR